MGIASSTIIQVRIRHLNVIDPPRCIKLQRRSNCSNSLARPARPLLRDHPGLQSCPEPRLLQLRRPVLLAVLRELLPPDDRWRHSHGSTGHGRTHVLPAFIPPYATIPIVDGKLALGTWQSIALVDLNVDNPDRQVRLSFVPG